MSRFLVQLRTGVHPAFRTKGLTASNLSGLSKIFETKKVIDRSLVFCYIAQLKRSILEISATRFG